MTLALYGKSRRRQWGLVALALFALLGAFSAALALRESARATDASTRGIFPVLVEGNVQSSICTDRGYDYGMSTETAPPIGTTPYALVGGSISITSNGTYVSFVSTIPIFEAYVKGGPNANRYTYPPTYPAGVLSDGNLHSPDHPSPGQIPGVSHVVVCYNAVPAAIAIEKTNDTGDNIVNPGEAFNWIIKVTVTGAATSAATSITDTIPADFTAGAPVETSDQLDCSASSGNSINCTLASGAPVGEYTITVPVTVSSEPEICGEPITNTAVAQMGTEPAIDDDDDVTINCGETIVTTVRVCKVFEDNGDGVARGDTKFDFEIDYYNSQKEQPDTAATSISLAEGEGPICDEVDLIGDVEGATFTELATPITDETGYPMYQVMDGDKQTGDSVVVIIWSGEGCSDESQVDFLAQAQTQELEYDGTCQVTFYNREVPGQVSPTGDLRIEKYLDINGDGDADDAALGEGPIEDWNMTVSGPGVNGVFPTNASGVVSFSGLDMGDNYAVTEALPGGWTLTNVTIDGAASALNVTKNVTIPDGTTRVVAFYNQPLGSLNVHKVAVTSHNAGPDVPAPNDDDGWTITVSSVACGINQSKQTDANGNASFTGLPLCTDYVVSENPVNAGSPGFNPVSPTSFSNQKPEGQTLTFTNRLATFDPPCQDCIQVTPTPTPTFTPTATPTTPPTSTPTTRPTEEATAGARTPGPTPIAPSTGTGGSGGAASMNLLLLIAGLAALSGGATLAVAGKRRR